MRAVKTKIAALSAAILFIAIIAGGATYFLSPKTNAADARYFNPENIISDYIFTDNSSMSAWEIQQFLNSKNSVCLKNFSTLSLNDQNGDGLGDEPYGKGKNEKVSAATLIWQAAQLYKISPKVILVTLQKEQGLITRTDCPTWRYNTALGYGCPDGKPCDDSAYGLTRQIDYGVWHFRGFFHDTFPVPPTVPGVKSISYNPDGRCGSKQLNIRNRATAALYSYTPYQPNSHALKGGTNSLYPSCGAFGNLNFWRFFTDWFGSTQSKLEVSDLQFSNQLFTDSVNTVSFSLRNTSTSTVRLHTLLVAVRGPGSEFLDFEPVRNVSIAPGKDFTYTKSRAFNGPEGSYRMFIAYFDGASWQSPAFKQFDQPKNEQVTRTLLRQPIQTTSLQISPQSTHVDSPSTATFNVKNNSATAQNFGYVGAAVRDDSGAIYDYPFRENLSIYANQTHSYSATRTFSKKGKYHVFVFNKMGTNPWNETFPAPVNSSIVRKVTLDVKDAVTLTQPLKVTLPTPHADNQATASFTIKNHSTKPVYVGDIGAAVRGSSGNIYDFPFTLNLTLQPGQEYTYSKSRTLPYAGNYRVFITDRRDGIGWSSAFPESEDEGLAREVSVDLKESVVVSEQLNVTPNSLHKNELATAQFKVKNYSQGPVKLNLIGAAVRDSRGTIYDFPFDSNVTINPGQEYTYAKQRSLPQVGRYSIFILNKQDNGTWDKNYPQSEVSGMNREKSITLGEDATLTGALDVTMQKHYAGNSATARFTLTNHSSQPVFIGNIGVAGRGPNGAYADFPFSSNLTLSPGQVYNYSQTRELSPEGTYRFFITNYRPAYGWQSNYPVSESFSIARETNLTLKPAITTTTSLMLSPQSPSPSSLVTATFRLRNNSSSTITIPLVGAAVRGPQGVIYDFAFDRNVVVPAGNEYTYEKSRNFPAKGNYEVFILSGDNQGGWSKSSPASESTSIQRSNSVTVR